jgi:hypothetical protein
MVTNEPDFFSVGMEDTTKVRCLEPDRDEVRAELLSVLAEAKSATEECPWDERTFKYHKVVFPQMANWLDAIERDQLRFEFAQEVERIESLLAA